MVPGNNDALLLLSENDAVLGEFDAKNRAALRLFMIRFAIVAGIYLLTYLVAGWFIRALLPAANLVVLVFMLRSGRVRQAVEEKIRPATTLFLLAQFVLLALMHGGSGDAVIVWAFVLPFALLGFRLKTSENLVLLGGVLATVVVGGIVRSLVDRDVLRWFLDQSWGLLAAWIVECALIVVVAFVIARRHRRRFVGVWSRDRALHGDRLRMKQELEHAREIQLSMLPRSAPEVRWLDISSLSLPATEVGGDNYAYIPLSDDRLAVAVADVAGHGVASGIVLSGVRAGLHLLSEDMDRPVEVLRRLNRMVKLTSPRRMIVTFQLALLDRSAATLTVASAGHPPILRWSAETGEVEQAPMGSLPLGALSDTSFEEAVVRLEAGDVLLLHTDGLTETMNAQGEQYGEERLMASLREAARDSTAQEVRDSLLADVWEYKGDTEQIDDITMVVVKVLELGG